MSTQMVSIILYISVAVIFIGFAMIIDWRKIAARWVAPNPAKARVFVAAGEMIDPVNGRLYWPGVKGSIYLFKWQKQKLTTYVKDSYPYKYLTTSGRRMINVYAGNAIAVSALDEKMQDEKMTLEEVENWLAENIGAADLDWKLATRQVTVNARDLDNVIRSGIGAQLVNSLFGKTVNIILAIVILAIVGVGGFVLVKNMMAADKTPVAEQQQPPAQKSIEEQLKKEGAIFE